MKVRVKIGYNEGQYPEHTVDVEVSAQTFHGIKQEDDDWAWYDREWDKLCDAVSPHTKCNDWYIYGTIERAE